MKSNIFFNLQNESIGSIESKNICNNITKDEFSWILFRFPLEFLCYCSKSIYIVYNEYGEDNNVDHLFWVIIKDFYIF